MQIEYRSFTNDTLADVLPLVRRRFGEDACLLTQHILHNPLIEAGGGSAGDIAYRDGRPVCFMATMVRRAYLGHEAVLCSVGGLLCKAERGCPLSVMIEVMQRMGGMHYGCSFGFGNTSSSSAWGVNKNMGGKSGPETWCRSRFCLIRPIDVALGAILRKVLRRPPPAWRSDDVQEVDEDVLFASNTGIEITRLKGIDVNVFNAFWSEYLSRNTGFVVSRTAEELDWIFGRKIRNGYGVLLGAKKHGILKGWIIIAPLLKSPRRWTIVDWIALDNDRDTLRFLLKAAKRFLKIKTNAWLLETRGFPAWCDIIIKQHLPFKIKHKSNPFFFFPQNNEISLRICEELQMDRSWFFGPYDGDMCL